MYLMRSTHTEPRLQLGNAYSFVHTSEECEPFDLKGFCNSHNSDNTPLAFRGHTPEEIAHISRLCYKEPCNCFTVVLIFDSSDIPSAAPLWSRYQRLKCNAWISSKRWCFMPHFISFIYYIFTPLSRDQYGCLTLWRHSFFEGWSQSKDGNFGAVFSLSKLSVLRCHASNTLWRSVSSSKASSWLPKSDLPFLTDLQCKGKSLPAHHES